jgi:uncharacterized membrane protein YGL010W
MKSLVDQLANYASYHRDKRNIATHFVGIPMIVVGTQGFLAKFGIGPINLGVGATAAVTAYYSKLDPTYGKVMGAVLGGSLALGSVLAALPIPVWAAATGTLFVGGWAIQFLGHKFEGKKPAFLDDLVGLAIGPLFLVTEAAFALGMSKDLRDEIERRVGPAHWGRTPVEHVEHVEHASVGAVS